MSAPNTVRLLLSALFILGIFLVPVIQASEPKTLPIETFLRKSDYLDIKLSPNGEYYAARVRDDERVYLIVIRISDGEIVGGVKPGDKDEVASVVWANNKRLIYTFAEKGRRYDSASFTGELFGIDFDSKSNKLLAGYRAEDHDPERRIQYQKASMATHQVLSTLPNEPKKILIVEYPWKLRGDSYYDDRTRPPIVSKLNIYTGKKSNKETILKMDASLFADDNGNVNFMTWPVGNGYLKASYRKSRKHEWEDVSAAFGGKFDNLVASGISRDGTKAYFKGNIDRDKADTLYEFDLASKTLTKLFDNNFDLYSWEVNSNNEPVVGVSFSDKIQYHYVIHNANSPEAKKHKSLVKAFKGQNMWLTSQNQDASKFIVKVSSSINPGEYYAFDASTMNADFLWANYSWIDPRQMQAKQHVSFKASDGIELSGYLTLPPSKHGQKSPLIVLPHGGPHGVRDYPFFDYESQLLANQGYAVLQVNFRGSGGYTPKFQKSGYKKWGTRMIDDIIDATLATIKRDDIDANKVCIYGASYGGYAALTSAAKANDLFKCTAGYVGVYDLEAMRTKGDIPNNFGGLGYLDKAIGDDVEILRAQSPIYMADKINAKVLLIHGDKDIRAPSYHSKTMRKSLRKAGNEPEWLYLGNVAHGAESLKNRMRVYGTLLKFLDENIGG